MYAIEMNQYWVMRKPFLKSKEATNRMKPCVVVVGDLVIGVVGVVHWLCGT